MIDLRVWYEDENGEYKPTKKGISFNRNLSVNVSNAIINVMSDIDKIEIYYVIYVLMIRLDLILHHYTVEVTEKTGLEVVNTESFDVNVCLKEIYKVIN